MPEYATPAKKALSAAPVKGVNTVQGSKLPISEPGYRYEGQIFQHLVADDDDLSYSIALSDRSIVGWRAFLKSADDERQAIELNVFLALATHHLDYIRTRANAFTKRKNYRNLSSLPTIGPEDPKEEKSSLQEERRKAISNLKRPSERECINLMIALLTTSNIDLAEIGDLSPALGYLLPRFFKKYYQSAILNISEKKGELQTSEEIEDMKIVPSNIVALLEQADESFIGGAFQTTKTMEPIVVESMFLGKISYPNSLPQIGISKEGNVGLSPTEELLKEAITSAHESSIGALGLACENSG